MLVVVICVFWVFAFVCVCLWMLGLGGLYFVVWFSCELLCVCVVCWVGCVGGASSFDFVMCYYEVFGGLFCGFVLCLCVFLFCFVVGGFGCLGLLICGCFVGGF